MKIFFDTNVYVAEVIKDINDSPILKAALAAGADYLVTNDKVLLDLEPI